MGQEWGRRGAGVGQTWDRCGADMGQLWDRHGTGVDNTAQVWGRCEAGMGQVWGRRGVCLVHHGEAGSSHTARPSQQEASCRGVNNILPDISEMQN